MVPKFTEREREAQIKKETIASAIVYIAFIVWEIVTGYVVGGGDPANYVTILGLPLWFILSCIVGPLWFCIAVALLVKFKFKDFDLESTADEDEKEVPNV